MLSVSPTGRLASDVQGEYTDIDRHFRARSKHNFALTFVALPMSQSLHDDESLLSDAASDSVAALLARVPATPASSPSSSSSESSDSEESEESSNSGSEKEKEKKKKKDKKKKKKDKKKKAARVNDDELADLQEGARRVASLTKTPDVDMNALFDPVRAETIRKSLKLHGRVDKIPVLTALAGRMASQAESATGRPTRVHGRVANGRIAEVVTGAGALERMEDIAKELEKPKKKKNKKKKKKSRRDKEEGEEEEEDSGISLGSQDSDDDEEDAKADESDFSSFIASSDEMDEVSDSDKSVVISSEESDSDSGSERSSSSNSSNSDESSSSSSSDSESSSSSSSNHKHKKHKKDKHKKHKKDKKKSKDKNKSKKQKKDDDTKAKKKKKHGKDKEGKSKKTKKDDAKKASQKKKEAPKPAAPAPSVKPAAKPTPNAAGLKKPLDLPVFASKPSSVPASAPKAAAAAAVPPQAAPNKKSSMASKTNKGGASFEVAGFLDKIMSNVASSSSDSDDEPPAAVAIVPRSNGSSSSNGKASTVEVPTTVSTKVGFSETYFSSVAMLALTKIAPLFLPTLEATYDLCGKYSPGLLKKIKMHEERAVDAGLAPTESDYATVEAQTARHLAFMLISLEPNAQNRLVHKAIDIACATDSGIKGPVPSMHTYPSNTMHRHFVDTLITALCRTSDSMARAYSAIYSGMRAQETPVAQLAVDLMHARNVTLLSKDVPLPAGLSQTYVCAVSGTVIAPGDRVNLYRITKRGPYEGEGWVDPRPWETDHLRQHSYVFATRATITGNKIALPFGSIVETPLVVVKPPLDVEPVAPKTAKRPREEKEKEKEGGANAPPTQERPEKRPRLDPAPPVAPVVDAVDAMDIDLALAPTSPGDERVRYVKLYPVKGSIYEGDKVLRVGSLFARLDKERRDAFYGGRDNSGGSKGGDGGGGGASDSVMAAMGLDMFAASVPSASNVPAKLQASVEAMRAAHTPAQMGAALGKAVAAKEAVWAVICLVQELVGDASEVRSAAAVANPGMDAFGELFGIPAETAEPTSDADASSYVKAPDGTTVNLAVWGLLLFMSEAMLKSPAIGGSAEFKRVRDAIKAFAKDPTRNRTVFDVYKDAMLLLIEAGTPLVRAEDA